MAKTTKQTRALSRKRTGNPTATKSDHHDQITRTRALKARFDVVHAEGMKALKRGDYSGFGKAIETEKKLIEALPTPKPRRRNRR